MHRVLKVIDYVGCFSQILFLYTYNFCSNNSTYIIKTSLNESYKYNNKLVYMNL